MSFYVKNKNRKTAHTSLIFAFAIGMIISGWFHLRPVFAQTINASINRISLSASLFGSDNRIVTNGTYEVRFGIYNKNREISDAYPSNTDAGSRLWEETQTVTVKNGIFRVFLGSVTAFPSTLNFENGDYYVGMRIGTDSEMVPRKQLGAVPNAINSQFLQGKSIGTRQGEIPLLGKSGKINIKNLPTGTSSNQLVLGNDSRLTPDSNSHIQNTDTGTTSEVFTLGTDKSFASTNFSLNVASATNTPALRFNATTQTWQLSNDGSSFSDISSGSIGAFLPLAGGTMTGDIIFAGSQTFTNLINLGADTVGNYVATITAGNGITGSSSTEGGTPTLAVNLLTSADGVGATSSNSGLEFAGASSNQLALIQGCANGQGISYNTTTDVWECASFSA
ncbi:MAG: hypothetical protein CO143_02430, partial [Candidatus Moranbacteria bacterium CG_4_9_14_3_um_filter_45_14]